MSFLLGIRCECGPQGRNLLYLLQQAGDFLLKAVQKEQTREFNRKLYENKKSGNQTEAVKQLEEQQRRNAKTEAAVFSSMSCS